MNFANEAEMQLMSKHLPGGNPHAGDERLIVKFYKASRHDKSRSAAEGRPIFVDEDRIEIRIPGDKDLVVDERIRENSQLPGAYHNRFAKQWERYKAGQTQDTSGTPLKEWPGVTASQVDLLAYHNVKTVEALAGMTDGQAQGLMGNHQLRQRARDWLAAAKENAGITKLRAEMDEKDTRLKAMEAQLAQLIAAQQQAHNDNAKAPLSGQPANDNKEKTKK